MDGHALRNLMGRFATGVTIVATLEEGLVKAMTANSLVSVSLSPAIISVCFKHESFVLAAVRRQRQFTVSILAAAQENLSRHYGGRPMASAPDCWDISHGIAVVRGAKAALVCSVISELDVGDHCVVFGQVDHAKDSGRADDDALVFFMGRYHPLGSAPRLLVA